MAQTVSDQVNAKLIQMEWSIEFEQSSFLHIRTHRQFHNV